MKRISVDLGEKITEIVKKHADAEMRPMSKMVRLLVQEALKLREVKK